MSALTNTHDVLLRNRELLQGRLALLGVSDPALLAQIGAGGLAMSEHAGVYSLLTGCQGWQPCYGYSTDGLSAAGYDTVVVLPKAGLNSCSACLWPGFLAGKALLWS